MPLNDFSFTIPEGLRNVTEYPSKPGSGTEAREQIQGRLDEVKDYLNNEVKTEINEHLAETAAQDNLGHVKVDGVTITVDENGVISAGELVAENVVLDSENFVADNVLDGMNELFTNVSNGKELIATAITDKGGSASGSDSFSDLAGEINNVASWDENLVAGNILSGKSIFGVNGVLTPRMYASGSANIILKNIDGTGRYCIEVEGLSFTPTVIMYRKSGYSDANARFGYYTSYFSATKSYFITSSTSIQTISGIVLTKNPNKFYVAHGGFCLPVNDSNESPCSWIAYG